MVLSQMNGVHALMARLLYGTGMRLMECMMLRIKDVDFGRREITLGALREPSTSHYFASHGCKLSRNAASS
jgi:integrase